MFEKKRSGGPARNNCERMVSDLQGLCCLCFGVWMVQKNGTLSTVVSEKRAQPHTIPKFGG